VRNQRVRALSISRPVFDMVKRKDSTVRVFANYCRACNLVTSRGEIIALVSPAIGNGPLNIVIEEIGTLRHAKPGLPAVFSDEQLGLGKSLLVSLEAAQLWSPEVNWKCLTTHRRRLEDNFAALCSWLSQNVTTQAVIASEAKQSPSRKEEIASSQQTLLAMTWAEQLPQNDIAKGLLGLVLDGDKETETCEGGTRSLHNLAFLAMARVGIKGLLQALQDGNRPGIRENAALLAGLGPGLTPAGDDYLVGLMAGLRVWPDPLNNGGLSPDDACQIILEATEDRTTLLSRGFLHSATEGLFGENWHRLLAELARGEARGIQQATKRILASGATSGADALAGFLSPYLWQRR
jgi:hypothetical protein